MVRSYVLAWSLARLVAPEPETRSEPGAELEPQPELERLPEPEQLPEPERLPELEPLPELDLPSVGDPATLPTTSPEPHRPFLRDVMTGSLRLTGAFLHFDDLPSLFPQGDDGLLATVGRVLVDRDWNGRIGLELNYFIDFSRSPTAGTGGAFGTAGSTDSVYRSPFLSWTLWEDGSVRSTAGVDRFAVDATLGRWSLKAGRFPVSYSVGSFFTPNDFLAPFSVTAVNRIYKPGVDALQIGASLGMIGAVEVTGVLGSDPQGTPTWGRSAVLARASVVGAGFEWSALGGKLAERWVLGGALQGAIDVVGLHAEAHLGVPDVEGNGRDPGEDGRPLHVRLTAGPTLNVGWHGLTLGAEYAFYSDGARHPSALIERVGRLFPDDVPLLGRHYVGAVASMEVIPILRASALSQVNAGDGSGLVGLSLAYSVSDEADLLAGVFVPWGADPQVTMDPAAPVVLGSELGASPVVLYFEARTFF